MIQLEDLHTAYRMARKNKRRSADAIAFEVSEDLNLHRLCVHINECTFRAKDSCAFISTYPQPREIFCDEITRGILETYILWRIEPILERVLSPRLFSNRKGKGTDAAIRQVYEDAMEVSQRYTRDAYFIQWDIKGFYPNAHCDIACQKMQQLVIDHYEGGDKDSLLWMIMICIHANPQLHYYRKSPREMWSLIDPAKSLLNQPEGRGGVIGFLIWQIAMNLYLNDVDHWIVDEMGLHYTRYADDSVIVVQNKEAALTLLPLIRAKYAEVGCTMHPRKFYCQHVSKGLRFLGSYIKYERIYIANRVVRRALLRVRHFNGCRKKFEALPNFVATVNSYTGRLKRRQEFNNIRRIWEAVAKEWHRYVYFDWDRQIVKARKEYTHKSYIDKRFKQIVKWKRWILSL